VRIASGAVQVANDPDILSSAKAQDFDCTLAPERNGYQSYWGTFSFLSTYHERSKARADLVFSQQLKHRSQPFKND
jgi:hypothetical protein